MYNGTMFYEVILDKNGLKTPLTYSYDEKLVLGQIVEVPLMKKQVAGVVIKKVEQPDFNCKPITRILYSKPLPKHLLKTIQFISRYYAVPTSSVLAMMLPNGILKKRRLTKEKGFLKQKTHFGQNIDLNPAQKKALEALRTATEATKLLFGITGSGKTNVYLSEADKALKTQKSVILLVPEIALTSQLVEVFRTFFGDNVILIHSKQTEAERHKIFEKLLNADSPLIVIGPRSALFAPLSNLGLIIVDEEHEQAYYQENIPRYSAVRVASFMAKELDISCILGSATPAICDFFMAKKCNSLVCLKEKAKKEAIKPKVKIIDIKKRDNFTKNKYFSNELLAAIKNNLDTGEQTLIFHNRRGSSQMTICDNCGAELMCPNCFLPLTLHADTYNLVCHICGFSEKMPTNCPSCGASSLLHKGFGTKLLESELKHLFPNARVQRFDADNKKDESLEMLYEKVRAGEIDILIGTQMLAKGLDLPRLATVGIVQADAGLALPDFAAEERVFQLLTQVIGRVGRGHLEKAEVLIQTFRPEHPVIKLAIDENYEDFAKYLLAMRKRGQFPPFCFIAKLEITMKTEETALKKIKKLKNYLSQNKDLIVSIPTPSFHEHTSRGYNWQIIVRAKSRQNLIKALGDLDESFKITLDPPNLL